MSPALLFQSLRWRLLHNALALMLARSWWRGVIIVSVCAFIWIMLFGLSWFGFHELRTRPEWRISLEGHLIERPFDLFFLALTALLTISTSIILYSSLFAGTGEPILAGDAGVLGRTHLRLQISGAAVPASAEGVRAGR